MFKKKFLYLYLFLVLNLFFVSFWNINFVSANSDEEVFRNCVKYDLKTNSHIFGDTFDYCQFVRPYSEFQKDFEITLPNEINWQKISKIWKINLSKYLINPNWWNNIIDWSRYKIILNIWNGIEELGDLAFIHTNHNNIVFLWDSVKKIWTQAFGSLLEKIDLWNSIQEIWKSAFRWTELKEIKIPDSVIKIWEGAFFESKIEKIEIWNGIEKIPDTFISKNKLTSVTIPNNVKEIWKAAFSGNKIENIVLSKNLEIIDKEAFSNNNFMEIEIPDSVKEIWENAFKRENQDFVKWFVSSENRIKEICKTEPQSACEKFRKIKFEVKTKTKPIIWNTDEETAKKFLEKIKNLDENNLSEIEINNLINTFNNYNDNIKNLIKKEYLNILDHLEILLLKARKNNLNTLWYSPKKWDLVLKCDNRVKVSWQECENSNYKKEEIIEIKNEIKEEIKNEEKEEVCDKSYNIYFEDGTIICLDKENIESWNSNQDWFFLYSWYNFYKESDFVTDKINLFIIWNSYFKNRNWIDPIYESKNAWKIISIFLKLYWKKWWKKIYGKKVYKELSTNLENWISKIIEYNILKLWNNFNDSIYRTRTFKELNELKDEWNIILACLSSYYDKNKINKTTYKKCFPKWMIDFYTKKESEDYN